MRRIDGLRALALAGMVLSASQAAAADKVTFGTNWKAQAEHGGYYQAVAAGIYEKYGLDVTIRQGGPSVNHQQLLVAGKIDFNMGGNMFSAFNYALNDVPMVAVAANFQKEPQVLIAHPGVGNDSLEAMKGKPMLISRGGQITFWLWLKAAYGYTDAQIRPYTFNPAPFLADKNAIQQGYVTSEPYEIAKAGVDPKVFLLADHGYASYSTTIETSAELIAENPDLVQRFVDATAEGWVSYLYGDPAKANALIKQHNPDMTDDRLAHSIRTMKDYGIVDSGDALTMGVNAMTDARWQSFFKEVGVPSGVYPADLDISKVYSLRFVNQGVGLDLKKQLLGK
ncbi:MAG: ABC transporter substrate-binding protein [Alphaproteobacteria bacterium]